MTEQTWLTAAEAATHAKRHVVTVRRAAEHGDLHGHQTGRGGHWRFKPAAVDAWIARADSRTACGCKPLRSVRRVA